MNTRRWHRMPSQAKLGLAVAAILNGVLHAQSAPAALQAADPAEYRRPALFFYGLASVNDNQKGFPKEFGYTVGGTLELTRFFGLTEEGSMLHWLGPMHTYTAVGGPRFSCDCGRLSPFGELMGGLGHAGAGSIPVPPIKSYGLTAVAAAGFEWRFTNHLSWMLQANTTRIYSQPSYKPLTGSTGLILRVFDAH